VGKMADFIVLNKNIMKIDAAEIPAITIDETFVGGVKVK
jgi:predicted amidohydrolase YtcJ